MTSNELITAIDQIRKHKIEDIKGRISSYYSSSSIFIVIQNNRVVSRTSNISFIYSGNFNYALFIVDYGFVQEKKWNKNNWEFAGIITPNNIIASIPGEHWSLTNIHFGFTPYGYMAPSFVFTLNTDLDKYITYETSSDNFDLAWKFFLELDTECTTYEQAMIYQKYYNERLRRSELELTVENFKTELAEKNSVIYQYKDLLKLIEEKIQSK